MSRQFLATPQPLMQGLGTGLLLLLSACNATQPEPPRAELADQPARTVAQETAAQPGAKKLERSSYAPPSTQLGALPMAPVADIQAPGYRATYREQYQKLASNPVQAVAEAPVSTFSIDVDTGGYANVRRFLSQGQLPPAEAVRLEELVNYFPYAYPLPQGEAPFGVATELAVTPWNSQSRLLRIAIKAADMAVEALPPANLVFLVDVSGSMDRREGLPLVQSTLKLLVDQLRAEDRVALVVYAGTSRVVLPSTAGNQKARIRAAIEQLRAGGSTAGESGIQLAYQQAQQGFIAGGINRILLATDGDFNVGISDFDTLKALAADKRKTGISLTTLGFGTGNYNERLMEQLADAGDGNYAYIDNLREARKVLVDQLSSTLSVVAKDVKIQLEFNPAQVSEYRLLGYENRALRREDFANDKVDAGEIGAGHSVTALYEIVPVGRKGWLEPLRYGAVEAAADQPAGKAGELALLRIRYKAPQQRASRLLEVPIRAPRQVADIAQASEDLRFAAAVAAFAQQLKGGQYTGDFGLAASADLARSGKGEDRFGLRGEFIQLVELAQSLQTPASLSPPTAVKVD
ncbi:vWA domain-containing protein [Pseudomonas benzenivorans]|uniref:VWA domain-containing protein n=1 Tax=Pseudomonas benzenivorans TaxID=556533 RepID=A0ABY5H9R8_9PSED|nr:VWA domain-containing protein [Pseudomonas benzenivorans]UTW08358.1 VWA domain-containing protein [Pseudomonas benzenivorans]